MRDRLQACLSIVLVAVVASSAAAERFTRICLLRGAEEVPPVTTPAVGCGRFEIDTCANTVTYRIAVSDLTSAELFAHIHGPANPGTNGGVVHTLPNGPVKTGTWAYPEALEADILAGRMYVNVHSANNGGGEVRGQIVTHVAQIDGAQEVPANASAVAGWGVFVLDPAANALRYWITYPGFASGELFAHIHGFANYGANSGVQHNLPAGLVKTGAWSYLEAQEQAIIDGLTYVNIHSNAFPGGEIRGQIVSSVNPLDPRQEVPAVGSNACGCGLVAIDRGQSVLAYDVRRSVFSTNELFAHIHGFAAAGTNAGVQHTMTVGTRKFGSWTFGAANAAAVLADERTYFNVHSQQFSGGEIRGQIRFAKLVATCVADITNGAGGGPDGGVGIEDLLEYLTRYDAGITAADVDDGTGFGCPDGGVGIEDLLYYLVRYDAGC